MDIYSDVYKWQQMPRREPDPKRYAISANILQEKTSPLSVPASTFAWNESMFATKSSLSGKPNTGRKLLRKWQGISAWQMKRLPLIKQSL